MTGFQVFCAWWADDSATQRGSASVLGAPAGNAQAGPWGDQRASITKCGLDTLLKPFLSVFRQLRVRIRSTDSALGRRRTRSREPSRGHETWGRNFSSNARRGVDRRFGHLVQTERRWYAFTALRTHWTLPDFASPPLVRASAAVQGECASCGSRGSNRLAGR